MLDAIRVGSSVLRYRGGEGQWAWAIHRVAGLGILAFLALHIADIFVAAFGPGLFNDLLFLYKGPLARVGEILLAFGLIYHALNGLRIIAADFVPKLASLKTARLLFYGQLVLFLVLFVPASYFMMVSLPQPEFKNNTTIALVITFAILGFPAVVALAASFSPSAAATAIDSDESVGNYADAFRRILIGAQRRRMDRFELNVWLFMRISGFLLIVLALLHMFILHFLISVEAITFQTIIDRWQDRQFGWFWRTYDLALLFFAFSHGMLGLRYVIEDYVHSIGWRRLLLLGAGAFWAVLILMGAWIIFFFRGTLA
jgi:succinate dehydrogenase / fumarate reductase cytochrome b subunit